ncbi:MAG: J domain-containing protein [Chloroflexota bacterium]
MGDPYTVLGVPRWADHDAIRTAYRVLARRCHPDFGGDERAMIQLNEAWHILGDPARRAALDAASARPTLRPGPPIQNGPRTVLDFGRYEGWSLTDIANADDDYLVWLSRTPLGRPLRAEIQAVLDERDHALAALRPPVVNTRRRHAWGR